VPVLVYYNSYVTTAMAVVRLPKPKPGNGFILVSEFLPGFISIPTSSEV
jgi:hypothetical protein